jgi:O-antigen/teichoic acid export membrane protein
MITLFFSPISFVLFPAVSRAWEENQKAKVKNYFEYSIRLFLTLALPSAVGLAMLSQSILRILTTSEYLVGWVLVLLVGIGTMFLGVYQINLYGMYLAKQTKWLPLMILVASVTSAGMNIILIPRVGIIGAAISNIASYFVLAVVVTIFTSKAAAYRFDFKYLGKIIMATLIMMACLWFIKVNSVPGIILVIIVGVAVYAGGLLLMKAFSKQDKALIKSVTSGLFRSSK